MTVISNTTAAPFAPPLSRRRTSARTANAGPSPLLKEVIELHRMAADLHSDLSVEYAQAEAAFLASFQDRPVDCGGSEFRELWLAGGAEAGIERRSKMIAPDNLAIAEVDRLRTAGAAIDGRREEFGLIDLSQRICDALTIEAHLLTKFATMAVQRPADVMVKLDYLYELLRNEMIDQDAVLVIIGSLVEARGR